MQSLPASSSPQPSRPSAIWLIALKVAGIYGGLAATWIVVSDLVVINRTGAPASCCGWKSARASASWP